MAKKTGFEAKKKKKSEEIERISSKLQKVEASHCEITSAKNELSKALQTAKDELSKLEKDELVAMISEKNLSTEELKKILNAVPEEVK